MELASRAAASRPTSSEAVPYPAGSPVAWGEDSAGVDIPKPCHRAQLALAGSVVASADVEAVASEEETEEASEEASTGPGAAGVSAVVVATEGSAVRMAMADHPPHRVDLATAEVDMAAVLTVVVTVVVIAVTAVTAETTAAAVAMEDATTTSSAAAAAAVVVIVGPTVAPPEATPSRSVHDTVAAPAAPPAVGTAIETTAATTPASDHTREAQVTKANANFDDTDNKTDDRWSCGGYLESTNFAFYSSSSHLFPLRQRG